EQDLRLVENADTRACEIAEQPLPIGNREPGVVLDQVARLLQRLCIARLLEPAAQLAIKRAAASAQTLDRALGLLLEIRLAAIEMIEAPRNLAGDLDMRDLIFADRHVRRAIQQDIRSLQQWITQEAVGGKVMIPQLRLLLLVRGHALEPT